VPKLAPKHHLATTTTHTFAQKHQRLGAQNWRLGAHSLSHTPAPRHQLWLPRRPLHTLTTVYTLLVPRRPHTHFSHPSPQSPHTPNPNIHSQASHSPTPRRPKLAPGHPCNTHLTHIHYQRLSAGLGA
ncbi:hypothetical protein PIB30_106522, partial [Stylosanthes scabra]|nr:hypothetical protein [Stylosanthes scabra]